MTDGPAESDRSAGARGPPRLAGDLPEAAVRRLESTAFSSGLTVPDFAACLDLGLQPVALVQGFCVMQWGWYGPGSGYMRGHVALHRRPADAPGRTRRPTAAPTATCPTSTALGPEPRAALGRGGLGPGLRERLPAHARGGRPPTAPTASSAWWTGSPTSPTRGRPSSTSSAPPSPSRAGRPRRAGCPWSTYLAGQRLTKSIEAGFMPVAVVAALASVRVWAYCMTEYLMEGSMSWGGPTGPQLVEQVSKAHMAVRQLARKHVRQQLAGDELHGATHRRRRPRALPGRRGHRLHAAGQPGAALQGLRPGRRCRGRRCGSHERTELSPADAPPSTCAPRCSGAPSPSPRRHLPPRSAASPRTCRSTRPCCCTPPAGSRSTSCAAWPWCPSRSGVWNWGRGAISLASDAHDARGRPGRRAAPRRVRQGARARRGRRAGRGVGAHAPHRRRARRHGGAAHRREGRPGQPTPPRPCRSSRTSPPATSRCSSGPAGCPSGSPSAPASSTPRAGRRAPR